MNKEITWDELQRWLAEGRPFTLVDVREAYERKAAHIGGVWVPLGELTGQVGDLAIRPALVFYCRKGVRSLLAVQRFQGRYPDVAMYSLRGGLVARPPDFPLEK